MAAVGEQIRALRQPPVSQTSIQRATARLNADFARPGTQTQSALDAACASASSASEALQTSLDASRASLSTHLADARARAAQSTQSAKELALLRHTLADELSALASQLTSAMEMRDGEGPTLLEELEVLRRRLAEQEGVRQYVRVVQRALVLSEAAVQQARSSSPIEVGQYEALRAFATSVGDACAPAGEMTGTPGGTLKLASFINEVRDRTWGEIKAALASDLLKAAEAIGWPKPVDWSDVAEPERAAFAKTFRRLLELQTIQQRVHKDDSGPPPGLHALAALVQPVALRFKYHFEGARATNKLDKPEWYFTHILNVAHEHRAFMERVVQLLLHGTPFGALDAWREFVSALLPLLHRRIKHTMPALLPHTPLLAHTIYQALAFDSALRDEGFGLRGTLAAAASGAGDEEWAGVSAVILERREWFDRWIDGERAFAEAQYDALVSAPDAWALDAPSEDAAGAGEMRPTASARRLTALLAGASDRMAPLPSAAQRLRFLTAVQLPLLASYRARVSASLDAFETLAHALVRAVPGALTAAVSGTAPSSAAGLTSGTEGAGRLVRAALSARWVASAMAGWGEELLFVELWADVHARPALRVRAEACAQLAPGTGEGTLFGLLVDEYEETAGRAERMLAALVAGEVEGALKPYLAALHGDAGAGEDPDALLSPALLPALALFGAHVRALGAALPPRALRAVYRAASGAVAGHVLQRALMYRRPGRVGRAQARRMREEAGLWAEAARGALPAGVRAEPPWARLVQGARVVGAEGEVWEGVNRVARGLEGVEKMEELVGGSELTAEEVGMLVRVREDYRA